MKSLAIIFVHNRPNILRECLSTLFGGNEHRFDEVLFINDNSKPDLTKALTDFCIQNRENNFNIINFNKGIKYAESFFFALNYLELRSPKYAFLIEQDYIFAKNGIDVVMDIFENTDEGRNCIGFSGYNNKDWYDRNKRENEFPRIQLENFGVDYINRDILWKPWAKETKYGKYLIQGCSNSCGSMFLDWGKISEISRLFPKEYENWKFVTCDKQKTENRNLNDGALSAGLANLWSLYAKKTALDESKYCALLDIMPSVSNHINGGEFDPELGENTSINGWIVKEGESFTSSPTFGKTYEECVEYLKQVNY